MPFGPERKLAISDYVIVDRRDGNVDWRLAMGIHRSVIPNRQFSIVNPVSPINNHVIANRQF